MPFRRQRQQKPAEQEAQRHAAHVTEKDPRRLPVPPQKAYNGGGGNPAIGGQGPDEPGERRDDREADATGSGFHPGDAVDPVHEIEQVHIPDPQEGRSGEIDRRRKQSAEVGSGCRDGEQNDSHGHGLPDQPDCRRQVGEVVQPGQGAKGQCRSADDEGGGFGGEIVQIGGRQPPRDEDRDQSPSSAARRGVFMAAAFVGMIEDRSTQENRANLSRQAQDGEENGETERSDHERGHGVTV